MVELAGRFEITSNRERGKYELCSYGRYDIMLTPKNHKPSKEKDLAQTVANAHAQIEEKLYDAKLIVG